MIRDKGKSQGTKDQIIQNLKEYKGSIESNRNGKKCKINNKELNQTLIIKNRFFLWEKEIPMGLFFGLLFLLFQYAV